MSNKKDLIFPLTSIYDGNLEGSSSHLFEEGSTKSICGREIKKMSAPVTDNHYEKEEIEKMSWVRFELNNTCKKCYKRFDN